MRSYDLKITDPVSGALIRRYTSLNADGSTNLGALNVEIDCPVFTADLPMGNATIKVWGISIQDISQALDLGPHFDANGNWVPGKNLQLFAGMAKGLPLANPKQYGLILQGQINSCFGNWQDTVQTLDFVVITAPGSQAQPVNITHEWPAGQNLGDMVKGALAVAYPNFKCSVETSSNLILGQAEPGFYENIDQFAKYVREVSQHIVKTPGYLGVRIVAQNNQFIVSDATQTKPAATTIAFTDLIGQPTWLDISTISFKTVMRADLKPLDYIVLPQTQVTTSAQSYAQYRQSPTFKGQFQIKSMRHVGNFRQASGESWVTVFEAYVAI
jgi:hypothetical protein